MGEPREGSCVVSLFVWRWYLASVVANLLGVRNADRESCRRWYARNREYRAEYERTRVRPLPEVAKAKRKIYLQENKEKVLATQRRWRSKAKDHLREYRRRAHHRVSKTPTFMLVSALRTRIRTALKRGGRPASKWTRTSELLGCTPQFLKLHIERQFVPGMTWENRSAWHVDHIIPCSAFDLTDPEQQKKCFHYTNLQPLWAFDNMSKGGVRRSREAAA